MSKKRVLAIVATAGVAVAGAAIAILPMTMSNAAAACNTAYKAGQVYTGGQNVSHNGKNWSAKWWTQNEAPSTGGSGVWDDKGSCGNGTTPPPPGNNNPPPATTCNHPAWAGGTWYNAGAIVKYSNGQYYRAKNANPGYDPIISTWYWEPFACSGGGNNNPPPGNNNPPPGNNNPGGAVLTEAQFNQMFPNRNSFYTYAGLIDAMKKYPSFASGSTAKLEMAAFLANVNHETGGLVHINEINTANYPHYCDRSQPYGCPAGQAAYHGRGPIQLSWNFNYKAAGDALGIDLLNNPSLVATNPSISMQTGLWYWMSQNGPNSMPAHAAITGSGGFGGTIRSINGSLECDGRNPAQVQSRVAAFQRFAQILGTGTGSNISC
jgi:predicted chitinase/chitodextrinase